MKNIAVFASGSGSDFQSVIDGVNSKQINGRIKILITNKEGVFALERAKQNGIKRATFKRSNFESNDKMYAEIIKVLEEEEIDLIVLAGYLGILAPNIVDRYRNKIINIHPSLIPKYCGMGFYGIKVHEAVIKAGESESGCTVHYVDEGADTGKIIKQVKVPVYKTDSAEDLQKRILVEEHKVLPEVVAMLCKD